MLQSIGKKNAFNARIQLRRLAIALGVIAWASAVLVCLIVQTRYDFTVGPRSANAKAISTVPEIEKKSSGFRTIMGLHPKCPCSVASVAQLIKIKSYSRPENTFTLLVYRPANQETIWADNQSIADARKQGIEIQYDSDGVIAMKLGIRTSGHSVCYDPAGELRFSGGITAGRGHYGDNKSADQLLAMLEVNFEKMAAVGPSQIVVTPVFGCEISK